MKDLGAVIWIGQSEQRPLSGIIRPLPYLIITYSLLLNKHAARLFFF